MARRTIAPLVLMLVLAACGSPAAPASPGPDDPVGGGDGGAPTGVDGTLTISDAAADTLAVPVTDALAAAPDAPVRVRGALFVDAVGRVLLCEAIAESFPPQCGGRRLAVSGLDLSSVPGLQEANGVRWAESVELIGTVGEG